VFLRAGGSGAAQIGWPSSDYFLLLMTDKSVQGLMKDKFELGGQTSVAAGPVGSNTGAGTDAVMHAAVLSYSRSQGTFTGLNLNGAVLQPEDELNMAVYTETAREMLSKHLDQGDLPLAGLRAYPQALGRYAAASTSER
jgi:lipid-binding SYLF domain-containing protein